MGDKNSATEKEDENRSKSSGNKDLFSEITSHTSSIDVLAHSECISGAIQRADPAHFQLTPPTVKDIAGIENVSCSLSSVSDLMMVLKHS